MEALAPEPGPRTSVIPLSAQSCAVSQPRFTHPIALPCRKDMCKDEALREQFGDFDEPAKEMIHAST